jgi:hypothetical protein
LTRDRNTPETQRQFRTQSVSNSNVNKQKTHTNNNGFVTKNREPSSSRPPKNHFKQDSIMNEKKSNDYLLKTYLDTVTRNEISSAKGFFLRLFSFV